MRIGEIASDPEFWMGKQFQNLIIFKVKFEFSKLKKNSINLFIFQIVKLGNSLTFHVGNLGNLFIFQYRKLQKFPKFPLLQTH